MTRIADPRQLTALGPARPLSERDFQTQIRGLAQRCHWDLIFHAPSVLTMSERGWPDLVMVRTRDRRLIFAELKAERGKLSPRQEEVLAILRALVTVHPEIPDVNVRQRSYVDGVIEGRERAWHEGTRVEVFVWRPSQWDAIVEALR